MATKMQERLEAARRAAEAAEARFTDQDRAEEEARAELEAYNRRKAEAERRELELSLARRADALRDAFGEDIKLRSVIADELKTPHSFIVRDPGPAAFRTWQQGITDATLGKLQKGSREKVDRDAVNAEYAAKAVALGDWNGITDFGPNTTHGHDLLQFLKDHPAVATNLVNAATTLAGYAAEERKS